VHGLVRVGELVPQHLLALGSAVQLHEADLSEDAVVAGLVGQIAPDEVYNLVGVSSVAQSWNEPVLTAQLNGVFVARLLQAVLQTSERTGRQPRLVQASSAEIFAGTTSTPQDERTPVVPRSPYGASKAFAHHLVQLYRDRGLHATNTILYNHESPRRPPSFVTRKITKTVAAIARGDEHELVLGNIAARRDWGWAPDYVEALVRAARHGAPDDYVIATGESHSVAEFVAAAFGRVGIDDWQAHVRLDAAFDRPTDAVELVGRPDKAAQVLGWSPTLRFSDIVGRMVDADLAQHG
jgi:GDPmannose 4,6-dehydratase